MEPLAQARYGFGGIWSDVLETKKPKAELVYEALQFH